MAETFERVIGAPYVHVFHHQLCADRHNADGNGFNTSPAYAASHVARSFSVFFLAARHLAGIDNVSYRWCPGTDHVIFDDMVSVPLRASTALQSAVLVVIHLTVSAFDYEFCETSSKQQCPDCNLYWEAGIFYCSCGRCLRMSRKDKEVDKSNNDAVSIPGYVIKKNIKRGARHGPSERQRVYTKAREMLHKGSQKKHGEHSSILARWLSDNSNRKSLSRILKLNQDGAQQPLYQRPDFAQAKRQCKRLHGQDLAGIKNHSSKPTSKTKKRTTVRKN